MKRPADQTGYYRSPNQEVEEDFALGATTAVVFFITVVALLLTGCATTDTSIGNCINGKVTWADGSTENCKILTERGSI